MLKCYLNLVASHLFLYHCKEQFFLFTIISFVLVFMRYISQDPAKYQEGTKMTMDFSILSLWLADSTPEAG